MTTRHEQTLNTGGTLDKSDKSGREIGQVAEGRKGGCNKYLQFVLCVATRKQTDDHTGLATYN